jgi:hypothetical protein
MIIGNEKESFMILLSNKETGAAIGKINDEQLQFLIDHLEEEFDEDTDYYLNRTTFDMLKEKGLDPALTALLEDAFEGRDELEIEWSRE